MGFSGVALLANAPERVPEKKKKKDDVRFKDVTAQ